MFYQVPNFWMTSELKIKARNCSYDHISKQFVKKTIEIFEYYLVGSTKMLDWLESSPGPENYYIMRGDL